MMQRDRQRFWVVVTFTVLWFCGMLAPLYVFATLPSDITFEVRPTNGDNTFGACFSATQAAASSGTGADQTQSNSALQAWSNLTTSGAGSTTLTDGSSGGLFTAAMQGNCIRINSGTNFQVGFYVINSITNSNNVVLDRTPTSGGAGASGAGKVGGATKSFNGQTTTTLAGSAVNGTVVYVKNEAWNEAVTLSVNCNSAGGAICQVICYNTSRGDNPTGSNRCENNKANSGLPFNITGNYWQFSNIIASHAGSGNNGFNSQAVGIGFYNCRSYANALAGFILTQGNQLVNSEADTNTGAGVSMTGPSAVIISNVIHNNTSFGINYNGQNDVTIAYNLIYANSASGINMTVTPTRGAVFNNTIHGNTGASSDGITCALVSSMAIFNNIFSSNGRDGVRCSTAGSDGFIDYNDYSANSGTARTNFITGSHDKAVSPSYANSGSGNFALGSGNALINAAFPGAYPLGNSTGKLDIGAVQSGTGGAVQSTLACPQ